MDCFYPVVLGKNEDQIVVGCGKCIACKKQKAREWSIRMIHELETCKGNGVFLTLTYNDWNMPDNGMLCKEDLQKFIKRFRKSLKGRKIKYFACGEYGGKTFRPHYHLILFNVWYDDFQLIGKSGKRFVYRHPSWKKGLIDLASVEYGSMYYVAGYVQKKLENEGTVTEENREFQLQSQGIGKDWLFKNLCQVLADKEIRVDKYNASIPRYYMKKIDEILTEQGRFEELEEFREWIAAESYERRSEFHRKFRLKANDRGFLSDESIWEYAEICRRERERHAKHVSALCKREGF